MNAAIGYSQEEYEFVNTSDLKWSANSNLQYYSNSINVLQVYNNNAVSKEDKKNKQWSAENVWLHIPVRENRAYTITFNVKNEHNPKEYKYKVVGKDKNGRFKEEWHETDIYWGLIFKCEDKYGNDQEFTVNYNNRKNMNEAYTYTSIYDSDSRNWQPNQDIDTRTIKIEYDGKSTAWVYTGYGGTLMKTFYNTKGLTWIGVKCGCAAQILVTNFKFRRQTEFGIVLPEIVRASEEIDNKNYSSAITILTRVLNSYKGAIPYYYRARAYVGNEYYKSAIDDCDKGLQYPCEREQRENLYFLRGFSKILLNDEAGISDMRQAGEIGMRFLRENDLLDYKPVQQEKQKSEPSSSRKTSIKQSSGRIPVLKKTK